MSGRANRMLFLGGAVLGALLAVLVATPSVRRYARMKSM